MRCNIHIHGYGLFISEVVKNTKWRVLTAHERHKDPVDLSPGDNDRVSGREYTVEIPHTELLQPARG